MNRFKNDIIIDYYPCQIDSCIYYNTCDLVHKKGKDKKIKCVKYKSIFDKNN